MQVNSEAEMIDFGRTFASALVLPCVLELKGDVGVGKTTFVRGLAAGLGLNEPVTSPSFTISKRYACQGGELVHYDFYRLDDPGLMSSELADTLSQPDTLVVIEWGGDVQDLLPNQTITLEFSLQDDNSREINISSTTNSPLVQNLWKTCGKLSVTCGKMNKSCVQNSENCGKLCEKPTKNLQKGQK